MTNQEQQATLDLWLKDHTALIYKIVRSYACDDSEDHQDLFQEITVQVWRSVVNFRGNCAVTTWLYRIALNTAIKWSKKERKHTNDHQSLDHAPQLVDIVPIQDARLDWLYAQIGRLNKVDRSLCLLLLDGFSYREMADIIGISETYVGVKINRIKKHLIQQSNNYDHGI